MELHDASGSPRPLVSQGAAPSLYATAANLARAYEPVLARLGVSRPQYLVLAMLWERDGLTARHIAAGLCVEPGTVEQWTKGLQGRRLIERDVPEAGASPDFWLTPRGRALRHEAPQLPGKLLCHVLAWLAQVEMGPER